MIVKVIGVNVYGDEVEVQTCNQGVVLEGDRLKDVATGQTVVWQHHSTWETTSLESGTKEIFRRVFVQAVT